MNSLWSRLIFASFHLLSYVSSESLDDESVNTFSISPESTPQKRTDLWHHNVMSRWRRIHAIHATPLERGRPNHGPTQVSNLINLFVDICLLQFCKTVFTCFWSHSRAKDHVYTDFIFPSSVVLGCDYPATLSTHVHALDVNTLLVGVMLSNLCKLQIWKKKTENKASLKTRYSCYTSKSRMTEESCLRTRSLSIDVVTSWSSNRLKKIEVIAPELPIWHVGSVYSLMWKKS